MTYTGNKRKSLELKEFTSQKFNFNFGYALAEPGGKKKCLEQDEFAAQGFNFKGDYAFTESGVLICHVLVYNMKTLMQQEELLEYCSGFGLVKKCDMVAGEGHHSDVGFLLFVDPKNASEMLKCPTHCHHNNTFSVGAACDRLQPDFNYSSDTSILDLNEDCLLMIFDHLSIEEQLQCTRASQFFRDIFKTKFMLKYKYFRSEDYCRFKPSRFEEILTFAGDCITGISIHTPMNNKQLFLKVVTKFCPNLRKVLLSGIRLGLSFIEKIRPSAADKIIEMEFEDTFLDDNVIMRMQELKNLEILSISKNSKITGAHLENFSKLKKLKLYKCKNLKRDHFVNAIKNMKDLHSIDIVGCLKLKNSLQEIIKYNPKLQALYINRKDSCLENVHELLYLKEFAIDMNVPRDHFDPDSALKALKYLTNNAQYIGKLKNLEKLIILPWGFTGYDGYDHSNIEGLLKIIKGCTKLKSVDVIFIEFTKQTYKAIFDLLKSMTENEERNHALTLIPNFMGSIDSEIIEKYQHPSILKIII